MHGLKKKTVNKLEKVKSKRKVDKVERKKAKKKDRQEDIYINPLLTMRRSADPGPPVSDKERQLRRRTSPFIKEKDTHSSIRIQEPGFTQIGLRPRRLGRYAR